MQYTAVSVAQFREAVKAALVAVWKFEVEKEHAVAVVLSQRRAVMAQVRVRVCVWRCCGPAGPSMWVVGSSAACAALCLPPQSLPPRL